MSLGLGSIGCRIKILNHIEKILFLRIMLSCVLGIRERWRVWTERGKKGGRQLEACGGLCEGEFQALTEGRMAFCRWSLGSTELCALVFVQWFEFLVLDIYTWKNECADVSEKKSRSYKFGSVGTTLETIRPSWRVHFSINHIFRFKPVDSLHLWEKDQN